MQLFFLLLFTIHDFFFLCKQAMNEEDVNALNEDDSFLKLMQDIYSGLTVSLTVRYKIRSGIIMA